VSIADLKIPFGLRTTDGRVVDVSQVERGKACECICPNCKEKLVAKKAVRTHHFAHFGSHCSGALESSVHRAAKQILSEGKRIRLPDVWLEFNSFGFVYYPVTEPFEFARIEVEETHGDIRPDLTCYTAGGRRLFVEIVVTHDVSEEKLAKIEKLGVSTISIHLSPFLENLSLERLKELLIIDEKPKLWLYNDREKQLAERLRKTAQFRAVIWRVSRLGHKIPHVDGCPLRKRQFKSTFFANASLDCRYCKYQVNPKNRVPRKITCLGHLEDELKKQRNQDLVPEIGLLGADQQTLL
jgi:hypothetical protein